MKAITCFLPYADAAQVLPTIEALKAEHAIARICLLAGPDADTSAAPAGCDVVAAPDGLNASSTIRAIAEATDTEYILLYTKYNKLVPGYHALERLLRIAADSGAGMLYADSYAVDPEGKRTAAPVIDYQEGSLRDDFNFGSLMLFSAAVFKLAAAGIDRDYKAAGLYDLRLRVSRIAPIVHVNEYLYTDVQLDNRRSGEKIFDYVDPKNRGVQIEMEQACTEHLKAVGGYLEPEFDKIEFGAEEFPVEATVVIPVRNRVRTIRDAINSVLSQKTDFPFNLIVVDNHSTDGTTEAIDEFTDPRVI
ncbi:MAG: glycosyltransferase family 2 protein, partial [Muribaculaceae bacterium]|nr:glycosyltransferase family 2 protein [Muribaculaceae bacterium]